MSHTIWFIAPLTCPHCGAHTGERDTHLHTSSLNPDTEDIMARPGDVLELASYDLEDGYLKLRDPDGEADIRALEQWGCPVCHGAQWARILFHREDPEHHRIVSIQSIALTPEALRDAHFLSRNIDFWLKTHLEEETGPIYPLVKHLVPWVRMT